MKSIYVQGVEGRPHQHDDAGLRESKKNHLGPRRYIDTIVRHVDFPWSNNRQVTAPRASCPVLWFSGLLPKSIKRLIYTDQNRLSLLLMSLRAADPVVAGLFMEEMHIFVSATAVGATRWVAHSFY